MLRKFKCKICGHEITERPWLDETFSKLRDHLYFEHKNEFYKCIDMDALELNTHNYEEVE